MRARATFPDRIQEGAAEISGDRSRGRRLVAGAVAVLLVIHGTLVGYSATLHSPTLNEPGHLVAGLIQWRFGRFEVYRVNPPLVHYAAALPVMLAGYRADWDSYVDSPAARSEMAMGEDFIRANGGRSAWLITLGRWGCLPFTLVGGLFCFFWSRELWGSSTAGLISLFLWCFEPFLMAHAEMITTDCAATSLGLGAGYVFWRWLRHRSWRRALAAGAALGLAELTKTTWVVLFGLWPALWLFWVATRPGPTRAPDDRTSTATAATQLAVILVLAVYILNLGYLYHGTLTRLGDYAFTSRAFRGTGSKGVGGNRFAGTWLGEVPVPLPRDYLLGIDLQRKDFEDRGDPSFLLGEWKDGGWWYYYLYGLSAKTTLGLQVLFGLGVLTVFIAARRDRHPTASPAGDGVGSRSTVGSAAAGSGPGLRWRSTGFRDLVILATPAVTVLALVSSQWRFNHHVRYVLPALGFAMVFAGSVAWWLERGGKQRSVRRSARTAGASSTRPAGLA
jgi:hypothetical protein